MTPQDGINCSVYRSDKKPETYLFLARGVNFEDLPEGLLAVFGKPVLVVNLLLSPERKLAQVDSGAVIKALEASGYFLQLPPKTPTEEEITRWLSR